MGKKEKVIEVKPPTDYFKGVQVDLKTVKTAVLNLESTEVSVLTKCASSIFNFIVKGRVKSHKYVTTYVRFCLHPSCVSLFFCFL